MTTQQLRGPEGWQPIETAPRDGTAIQAEIPGHGADNVIAFEWGLVDDSGNDCGGWCFVTEQEPPDDWTDGWCWAVNEDGVPSTQPTRWKPLPEVCPGCDSELPTDQFCQACETYPSEWSTLTLDEWKGRNADVVAEVLAQITDPEVTDLGNGWFRSEAA